VSSQVADKPFRTVRLDASLDDVIAPDAKREVLGERFGLTEGPVWVRDGGKGYLLFSGRAANVIYMWASGEPLSVFPEKSGYTAKTTAMSVTIPSAVASPFSSSVRTGSHRRPKAD
jgi:sugar lactone lactonase YvrE